MFPHVTLLGSCLYSFEQMTSEEILTDLRRIIRALNLESKRIQKAFGISIPQLLAMNYLIKSPNYQTTTSQLAKALTLNPSTITGIVARLEKRGYVAKLPKQGDKRVTHITLTAAGHGLLQETPMLFHEKLDVRLAKLSEQETTSIREALALLTNLLELGNLDASPMLTVEVDLQGEDPESM